MSIEIKNSTSIPARSDLLARVVTTEEIANHPSDLDTDYLSSQAFEAKEGQVIFTNGSDYSTALIGLGEDANVSTEKFRQAGASLLRGIKNFKSITFDVGESSIAKESKAAAIQAFLEGALLGDYEFTALKSKPPKPVKRTITILGSGSGIKSAIARAESISRGVNTARDFVNLPGGDLTPVVFARKATALAKENGLSVKVLDGPAIKKAKMGGILGVNRGSTQQPRFVQLTYKPNKSNGKHIILVGKGITFDAGGLSIKTAQGMSTMKCDMGGAAAVLGAMIAIGQIAPNAKVTGLMPLTDNMLGGDATRPGDVLHIKNGKTVEVLNTDAEGRLILADALSVASKMKADAIVDLATLTGACMVALGSQYAGLMGTDDSLISAIENAALQTGERVWHLPLPDEYRSQLDSNVADVKNIGSNWGGALTAGLFLKEFVSEEIPWAHLDIAGPAFADTAWGEHPKGGTGFGVRLLIDLVENF